MLRCMFLVCFLSTALGVIIRDGSCGWETIASVRNLNTSQMLGEWHQIQRIENPMETGECSTLMLAVETTNTTSYISVSHKELHGTHVHNAKGRIDFINETLGLFNINYANFSYPTVVLGVDYTKYALLYSCAQINANQSLVVAWVYSRSASLQQADKTTIDGLIRSNEDLRNATWIETKHTKEACNVNAGITFRTSPILTLLAVFLVGKNILLSN